MSSRPPVSRNTSIVVSAVFALIAGILILLFVLQLSKAKGGKVQIGETQFKVPIKVTRLAGDAARAPLFFADARGTSLDLYISHTGSDPRQGWQAFEAHVPTAGRSCDVVWQPPASDFLDACTGRTYPANGAGLNHYFASIDGSDHLIVDFQRPIGTSPQ